jgi:hypothetical protein
MFGSVLIFDNGYGGHELVGCGDKFNLKMMVMVKGQFDGEDHGYNGLMGAGLQAK